MTPSLDEYVAAMRAAVPHLRAERKARTLFGPAGRATVREAIGERVIYGPNGAPIARVIEDELTNTQIEEHDRLHAVMRPPTLRLLYSRSDRKVVRQWTSP